MVRKGSPWQAKLDGKLEPCVVLRVGLGLTGETVEVLFGESGATRRIRETELITPGRISNISEPVVEAVQVTSVQDLASAIVEAKKHLCTTDGRGAEFKEEMLNDLIVMIVAATREEAKG